MIRFYLRTEIKNKKGEHPINISYMVDGKEFRRSIKISSKPSAFRNGRFVGTHSLKNESLEQARLEFERVLKGLKERGELSFETLSKNWKNRHRINLQVKHEQSWEEHFNSYLNWCMKVQDQSSRTVQAKMTLFKQLKEFESETGYPINDLMSFDNKFYDAFTMYRLDKGDSKSTLARKIVRQIKPFLYNRRNRERMKISNDVSTWVDYQPAKENIYLTQEELDLLDTYQLSSRGKQLSKNYFLLSCYTGLRISDIYRLNKDHIHGDLIRIRPYKTRKTNRMASIFISEKVRSILEMYQFRLPYRPSAKINNDIKEICKSAGINKIVEELDNGEFVQKPKYEIVSLHMGVRTFINAARASGVSIDVVSRITAKDKKTILKYYEGYDDEEVYLMKDMFK